MKKHSNSEGPRIEDHVNEPDKLTERDLGVAFGRLIELGIVVKKRAHGQDMPFSFSAQANLARSNPAAWFAEFSRHLDHDEAKLRRKKKARYDIFLNMALGLASKLPPIPSKPLSIADIFRGYYAQRGFTMAYYAKWGAKAKKDANGDGTSDEGPNEDDEKIAAE